MNRLRPKLTYSNVVSTICLFLLLGGGAAYAATHLGKNTVGAKQLKKNAVTTAKIRKEAVTAARVKKGTLTGTQINASTLGTVPTAQQANTLAPAENWHEVGAPGEPRFEGSWENTPPSGAFVFDTVAFYKDRNGIVHLRGVPSEGSSVIFYLPPGYRPRPGKTEVFGVASDVNATVSIFGSGQSPAIDGAVFSSVADKAISLDGITFRAES
jgi:hypothetical protein